LNARWATGPIYIATPQFGSRLIPLQMPCCCLKKFGKTVMTKTIYGFVVAFIISLQLTTNSAAQAAPPATDSAVFHQLQFRFLGPPGNRATSIVGEPENPLVIYIGAASGGIFKTTDGGTQWKPIFDDQEVSAIGALTIADSEPHTIWAGTGEPWLIRPDHAMGDGVYKSTNAGKSWTHLGLEATGHIARIVVDPRNSSVVYVCAVGQVYRPQQERGIFKTVDGGKTWKKVLFIDEGTGCSELAMDPHDAQTLFAGMWQFNISTWKLNSGGTGGGVYVSHNGGETWQRLSGNGLPSADTPVGKIDVQIAPSDPDRIYALIEQKTPTLYRSDDAGKNWRIMHRNHRLAQRGPYFTRFGVSPDNENLMYFLSAAFSISRDGGETLSENVEPFAGDNHDIWIDPHNSSRILIATDHGASITMNGGKSYYQVVLPIAQMYHVFTDNQVPYYVYGNMQDGPSFVGPSNNLEGVTRGFFGGGITAGEWRSYGGCESGFGVPDPADFRIVWSGCYDGELDRTDMRTGQSRSVMVWPEATYGWSSTDVRYRWHWTFPIAISTHNHNTVYVGSQYVHMTTDGGQTWKTISPDLTLNDKSHEGDSGGLVNDNLDTFDGAVLFSIAESPLQKGLIWSGSNDGQVNITRDGGGNWNNVTRNIPGLPPWGTVSNIEPSHFEAGAAYITVDLQQVGNYDSYVYKTSDFGKSWKLISGTIPKSVSSFSHCVREDPIRAGMLYLGTDNAIYISWDDGGNWTRLRNNLPPAPVYWIEVQPQFNDLVLATYGRGFWVLDDISPLRNWDQVKNSDAYLFPVRSTYRFRTKRDYRAHDANSSSVGENPPDGADINFYLRQSAKDIQIEIVDVDGKVVRTIKKTGTNEQNGGPTAGSQSSLLTGETGLNRLWWNLQYEPLTPLKLRVSPPGEPWVRVGPDGTRHFEAFDSDTPPPRVAPGNYTVKLTVNGKSFTQPLTVMRDPNSVGTEADVQSEVKFLLGVMSELNQAADMINRLEWLRLQLEQLQQRVAGTPKAEIVDRAVKDLAKKATEVEDKLIDVHLTGEEEDSFRNPMRLYEQMLSLLNNLGLTGSDQPPTSAQIEVNAEFQHGLADAQASLNDVMQNGVSTLNRLLQGNEIGGITP
jgi:photosystem II stability/assembly factor-like uncharacterized protein